MNANPIFIEYYPHEKCDCFKIKNPWTKFREEKIVLCPVTDGLKRAKRIAEEALVWELKKSLELPLEIE